jgi:hypothetical protein
MTNVDQRDIIRGRRYSCFQWTNMIAKICIPLIIAIYSIIDNNNKGSIADADRRKDKEIANISRISDF